MNIVEQIEIFPAVTDDEKRAVRALLERYPRMKTMCLAMERRTERTDREEEVRRVYQRMIDDIHTAIMLIVDDEVRLVLEERFFRSRTYKTTIFRFASMSARTIDRRINEGVETVAECLKLWGHNILSKKD
ncbi:hypothetical protein [Saccharibacillus brassicae]|uniref:Uncharacterized protein n=1 Tax=Saccharibacillus brassicae TaxID=2583377 RepID=A0A4Y6V4A4_SACBS|nr:hypothetical protein [Saccharibacillus brassicae]QDH23471.1 hypothetical protein FFV09_22960 [Saccharibacillus brassicae]